MNSEENKLIVQAFYKAFEANDKDALREVLAPDLVAYNPIGGDPQNREGHIQGILMWNTVFSQNRFEIKEQISDGDTVATRVVLKAVHSKAEFQGVPPTGKQIETPAITIERIKDGKIVERQVCSDRLGMMQQLGLMPSP